MDDHEKDPVVVLPYLVGRPLTAAQVYEAFGLRKSAYYKAAHEGRLITADNLIRVARYFHLNAVDLLIRYGMISRASVTAYAENSAHPSSDPPSTEQPSTPLALTHLHRIADRQQG